MELKWFCGTDDLTDPLHVRDEVFTREQGFASPDSDAFDRVSDHAVLYDEGRPVATGRIYREADAGRAGRIAVLKPYRGRRLGKRIMDALEARAREQGARRLLLGAQLHAVPFYQKCGFVSTGERYFDEFCEHEILTKQL